MRGLVCLVCVACGRLDFDPRSDGSVDTVDTAPVAPWVIVQIVGQTSLPLPVTPTGAGSLLVVEVQTMSTGSVSSVTDDASNIYVSAAAKAVDAPGGQALELWYAPGAIGGATRVDVTSTGFKAAVVWEVRGVAAFSPLEMVGVVPNGGSTMSPLGPPITTQAPGELVISSAVTSVSVQVVGIHPGNAFTNDSSTLSNGWAHLTDAHAPPGTYQAQWDNDSVGTYCANAAAFRAGP